MIMDRRRFLRNGGLFGALVGAAGAPAVMAASPKQTELPVPPALPKEDISHLAPPDGAHTLQICGSYRDPEEVAAERMRLSGNNLGIGGSPYLIYSNSPATHSVAMTVGKDNRLWMKVGDKWQRVALES